jgi:hypothetical protein
VTDTVSNPPTHFTIEFPVFYKPARWEVNFLHAYFPVKTKITFINSTIHALFFEETAQAATKHKAKKGN